MIAEEQQEQAALYALGLLTADEAAVFETAMRADPELGPLARELRETVNLTVLGLPEAAPSPELKTRVLALIAAESKTPAAPTSNAVEDKIVAFRPFAWVPWAIAAALAVFCGVVVSDRADLRRELAAARPVDPLSQVAVYGLGPAGDPKAAVISVAWEPGQQSGRLQINGLNAPKEGTDYQLWAVDAGSKDAIGAGVVKVDAKGHAYVAFKPDALAPHVNAFAISVEPAGGSPKTRGPIVFVGKQ